MKRVKIMLSALVVLALVGGVLAFKAQNSFGGNLRCTFPEGIDPTVTVLTEYDCNISTYSISMGGKIGFCTFKSIQNSTEPCYKFSVIEHP